MLLSKAEIARLIPHAGSMCLLDGVARWDASSIRCFSRTHQDTGNPMCAGGRLSAVCGIEFAAQAMAVHGSLVGNIGAKPCTGYLASVRDVEVWKNRLDDLPDELIVDAEKLMGDENRVIYQFTLRVGELEILSGRATVVFEAEETGVLET